MSTEIITQQDAIYPVFDRLEEILTDGGYIKKQGGMWWLFDADGNGLAAGDSIRGMCVNLVLGGTDEP